MCLGKVTTKQPKPAGHGWKVFQMVDGFLRSPIKDVKSDRPVDKWFECQVGLFSAADENNVGFHIYLNLKDAKNMSARMTKTWLDNLGFGHFVIRKVYYRKAVSQGWGDGGFDRTGKARVVVAREIFIPAIESEIFTL